MSDHLIVQIFLRWGLGILLVVIGVGGILLVGFAGAMSDGAPDAQERASDDRWALFFGSIVATGLAIMVFL